MKTTMKKVKGFTLLELMVVVAIIGVLATVAIPLFGGLLKRSKTTEAKSSLGDMRTLQEAYHAEYDMYIGVPPLQEIPAGLHTDQDGDKDNMSALGFHPKGVTRYAYTVDAADSLTFTAAAEGNLDDDAPMETRLNQEIVITQEVRNRALDWNKRGALLFGLSDKPDEASVPTSELASQGYLPLHQVETHVVGE